MHEKLNTIPTRPTVIDVYGVPVQFTPAGGTRVRVEWIDSAGDTNLEDFDPEDNITTLKLLRKVVGVLIANNEKCIRIMAQ